MVWLQNNWVWLAAAVGFMAMHFFGHGGHRHGRDNRSLGTWDGSGAKNVNDLAPNGAEVRAGRGAASADSPSKQHRHGC